MPLIKAEEAPKFDLGHNHFIGLAAPSRGASEICTWHLQIDAGTVGEGHWLDHEEVFIGLEGTFQFLVDGQRLELNPGDAVVVPARATMEVGNQGQTPARAIVCTIAGFRATFANGHEVGTPPWAS